MKTDRSRSAKTDRDSTGKFASNNQAAKGHGRPYSVKAAAFRRAMFEVVSTEDIESIIGQLVLDARLGNIKAASLLLDRLLGGIEAVDVLERLEALEAALEDRGTS